MSHVRKLEMTGKIPGRDKRVSRYHSWPEGENINVVNSLIHDFRNNFESVTIKLEHNYLDD